ncbi:hypothetical protein Pint_19845 [Pistacia integerrima]|uniref:Uncharacterized protein n=1 Tax=Pistacia integerrima TaxID=434235 RepID=A0ACC0XAH3_9ROSI|nr:hypothetical protein Pint_19845 [Pistacia integerrima]
MTSCLRKRKKLQNTDESVFLTKNGQILLEKLITSCNGKCDLICGFSAYELKNAIDNYALQKVIRDGFVYRLYKGVLQDRTVSIMKFNDILDEGETHINDAVVGTVGYIAPEYMITSKNGADYWLLNHVMKLIEDGRFEEVVDPILLRDKSCPIKEKLLQTLTELVLKCVCESAEDRPTMIDVAKQLKQMSNVQLK